MALETIEGRKLATDATGDSDTSFEDLPVASWTADGRVQLAFPVTNITETGGNRIVERERPFRDGAKLDDTGNKAKRWSMTAIFNNSLEDQSVEGDGETSELGEPGIKAINGDRALYPEVLNLMIDSFDVHNTGDLVVPTRGKVRARLESYTRREATSEYNTAIVDLVFVQDNEDDVTGSSFSAPTANSNATMLSETTSFSADSNGMDSASLQDLKEFLNNLEGLANYPGDIMNDLQQQANIINGAHKRVIDTFSKRNREGRDILLDPESSVTQRKIEKSKELAMKSTFAPRRGRPPLQSLVFNKQQSIFSIAAILGQSAEDLMEANSGNIENMLAIPPGTIVKVHVTNG